jgi:hypothetical protein
MLFKICFELRSLRLLYKEARKGGFGRIRAAFTAAKLVITIR